MARDRSKDIAVVGISARFPGADDLDEWWSALLKGQVFTTRYSRESLVEAGVPEALLDDPDYVPVRAHLDNADRFDHHLFRVSPRDAEMLDPQHRLMLETAWAAIEDSGYGQTQDRPVTGVFASGSGSGYMRGILTQGPLEPDVLEQVIHGTEPDFIASLIAYKLNLTGPAVTVQTGCSSSLVGTHLAVQALRNGDCDQALVVAAGIAFPQAGHLYMSGGIHSKSGNCRPFDHKADGLVEGSGVACIVLRRLNDVPEDSPELHGVILGTAINNDGATKIGYFAPSIVGQAAVIRKAVQAADVDAASIAYLETHGTGTPIGDPIEWAATSEAYTALGAQPGQIAIGALKANIGHLDAAAGLASLIRAMRVVKEGCIPPLAHFERLNPYMDVARTPLCIPNIKGAWMGWNAQAPRRAAISALGIGGTNAHIIIEQAPVSRPVSKSFQITRTSKNLSTNCSERVSGKKGLPERCPRDPRSGIGPWRQATSRSEPAVNAPTPGSPPSRSDGACSARRGAAQEPECIQIHEDSEHRPTPHGARAVNLWTGSKVQAVLLSAADPESLARSAEQLRKHLLKQQSELSDVATTLAKGRTVLPYRFAICGRTSHDIASVLNQTDIATHGHIAAESGAQRPIFLFPGQGSQSPGMARPFAEVMPSFLTALELCLNLFESNIRGVILRALLDDTFPAAELNRTELAQPALFAFEYAVAQALIELGVAPAAVIGHSLGEITAACLAGLLDLADAAHFVTARGQAMQACPEGSMLSIACDEQTTKQFLHQSGLKLNLAAVNTAESCVVSGELKEIDAFQALLSDRILSCRLKTDRAFHSQLIDSALPDMAVALEHLTLRPSRLPIALNATGKILDKGACLTADAFLSQARQPVQFSKALHALNARFPDAVFIEVGAGHTLSSMADSMGFNAIPLLSGRNRVCSHQAYRRCSAAIGAHSGDAETDILSGLGTIWAFGLPVDPAVFHLPGRRIHLPTYPFFGPRWMAPEAALGLRSKPKEHAPQKHSQPIEVQQAPQTIPAKASEDVLTILAKIWAELFSYNIVDEETDFFDLGGDSLLITRLIRKVNRTFNIQVPPRAMLGARTLGSQAALVREILAD